MHHYISAYYCTFSSILMHSKEFYDVLGNTINTGVKQL